MIIEVGVGYCIYIELSELGEMCEDVWRWQSQNPNGYSRYK